MKLIKSLLISLTVMAALVIGYAIPSFAQAPEPAATLVPDISDAPAAVAPIVELQAVPATPVPDVTDVPDVATGDEVVLMGPDNLGNAIHAEELAEWAGTIPYEIFCGISKRVPRVYLK